MNRLTFGIFLWFATYGALSQIKDLLRWLVRHSLRRRGHEPDFCETCSGRERRKHEREVMSP